jgi:hypothetical protein
MARTNTAISAPRKRRFGPGRSRLRQAEGARGHRLFNLWYQYSSRLRRDVVLKSDVEFAHFCWVEGDPNVRRYELEPAPAIVAVGTESQRTQFDALVELRRGPPQLREIKTSETGLTPRELAQREAQEQAAVAAGFEYVRITQADLAKHRQLIRNWRCALAYLAACRELVLETHCAELLEIAGRTRQCALEPMLQHTNPDLRPVYLAALFRCLQEARLSSDLDVNPLCAASLLWVPGGSHD